MMTTRTSTSLVGFMLVLACGCEARPSPSQASASERAPEPEIEIVEPPRSERPITDVDCKLDSPDGEQNRNRCLLMDATLGRSDELDRRMASFVWDAFLLINDGPRWIGADWMRTEPKVVAKPCDGQQHEVDPSSNRLDPTWLRLPQPLSGHGAPDAKLWDQNGNPVRIESRFNKQSVNFELPGSDPLHDIHDQLALACKNQLRVARWAQLGAEQDGPIRLKLAWKRLDERHDDPSRFLLNPDDPNYGLVAMHVALKTDSTRDLWLWATFEHRNNVDPLGDTPPLFRGICDGQDCPKDNTCWTDAEGVKRTQIARITPIAAHVAEINAELQRRLAGQGSVLQYYELIGVQRPFAPACAPPDNPDRRNPQTNEWCKNVVDCADCRDDECMTRCGAVPRPYILANTLIEWDHQRSSCMGCHSVAETWGVEPEHCDALAGDCQYRITRCEDPNRCLLEPTRECNGDPIWADRAWRAVGVEGSRGALVPNGDMFFPFQQTPQPNG